MNETPLTNAAKKQEAIDKAIKAYDDVGFPQHYDIFPCVEVIDVIRKQLTPEEFEGYCKGNILKYRLRAGKKKDAMQDIGKADWYESELRGER